MCRLGLPRATLDRARAALEIGVLRGPALEPGLDALRAALPGARTASHGRHAKRPQKRLGDADWAALDALVGGLQDAFAGFTPGGHRGTVDLAALPVLHEQVLTAVGSPAAGEEGGAFAGISGEALAAFFDELKAAARREPGRPVRPTIRAFFDGLMAGRVVRRTGETHRRVRIWGLLEARLLSCRPRRARRARREDLAARNARRRLPQPADAAGSGPARAGTADRPDGARFRAGAGRAGACS